MKKLTHYLIPLGLGGLVLGIVLAYGAFVTGQIRLKIVDYRDVQRWGQFGDTYGFLNACFTGIAVVGVITGFAAQRRQRKREEASVITAIRTEMELSWEKYEPLSAEIAKIQAGGTFRSLEVEYLSLFPVFNANAEHIGKIGNDDLRSGILRALGEQVSMLAIMKLNAKISTLLQDAEFKVAAYQNLSKGEVSNFEFHRTKIEYGARLDQAQKLAERLKERDKHVQQSIEEVRRLFAVS